MAAAPPPTALIVSNGNKSAFACVRCAERKVKCDRQNPCGACVSHKADCVFQPPPPRRKRRRLADDKILTDRLRHYESLLQEKGVDPGKLTDTPQPDAQPCLSQTVTVAPKDPQVHTPFSIESETSGGVSKTQVIHGHGRSMFVDNSLWSRVVEEFYDPEEALEDGSDYSSDLEGSGDEFGFVLNRKPKFNAAPRHPPPDRIHQLWQIFIENVDPLTKVVHVPTLRPAIEKAASNTATVPRSFEALMFAIYAAAVMSLNDDDCKERFGEPRKALLSQYTTATKRALSRARFMETTSLVVLQALVLHLLSVQDIYGPRAIWSLSGVAVRIAQSMGLERDGMLLNLSPFEAEMRRRIWWLLKAQDYHAAELCGLHKFRDVDIGLGSTKRPANLNDAQLFANMLSLPAESETMTDFAFAALRYELVNFAMSRVARFRQQGKADSQWDSDLASEGNQTGASDSFKEIEELLETKYLRYCDPSQPLQLMSMLMARSAMNVIRFLTHHPRRWASINQTPDLERVWVWEISIKLLEQHSMLQTNSLLKRFAWYAPSVMQWHALIHVLDTLRANPLVADAEKAWVLIGNIYENNPGMVFDTKKAIHVAVGRLCLEAHNARTAALLQKSNITPPLTPDFISQLSQQRRMAKAKRQAPLTDNSPTDKTTLDGLARDRDIGPNLGAHETAPQAGGQAPAGGNDIDTDPFWLINGFDDKQADSLNDGGNLDLDFSLAPDYNMEGGASHAISWEQWDNWIAESNAILPFSSAREPEARP